MTESTKNEAGNGLPVNLPSALALLERRSTAVPFEGYGMPDANLPGNVLLVAGPTEVFSFAAADVLDQEQLDSGRVRTWVRAGAKAWRSVNFDVRTPGRPEISPEVNFLVNMEDFPPPPMELVAGMPREGTPDDLPEVTGASITSAAKLFNNGCLGGDSFANNCAHFLSDAFLRAGFSELKPPNTCVNARCTIASRPIRARDMWCWFKMKATTTMNSVPPNGSGVWAMFQLNEIQYWGGHVVIYNSDSQTWHGTGWYQTWSQYAYKW